MQNLADSISDVPPICWLALPIYLAVGVALWRSSPWLRCTFGEAGYTGGMILSALIWPCMLVMSAVFMAFYGVICLFETFFRLFRRKH
jgi:hypothetical protein